MEELLEKLIQDIGIFVNTLKQTQETRPLVILVKGSRFTKMERVIAHLMEKEIPCY
jgi:UDP-N-acetylmuramyl pentapeptide synthase